MKTTLFTCATIIFALALRMTLAEEAAPVAPAAPTATPAPAAAAQPQDSAAQRAEMRARREKFMAERKAAMEAKMLEIVKKYVPEEEKAKALVKELQEAMLARPRGPKGYPLPPPKPAVPAAQ